MTETIKRVNVYGEFRTSDVDLATYLVCVGYTITRCETNSTSPSTWTIAGLREFDLDILEAEAKSETTVVLFHDLVAAQRCVWAVEKIARAQYGLFTSPKGWGRERGVKKVEESNGQPTK